MIRRLRELAARCLRRSQQNQLAYRQKLHHDRRQLRRRAVTSTVSTIQILNNIAVNLEDRASDGQGGLLPIEPEAGHFIILNSIVAPAGAEIAWNQVMQTIGQSSTTDVINLYRSQGSAGHPIWVHDNYIEGDSSPVATPQPSAA